MVESLPNVTKPNMAVQLSLSGFWWHPEIINKDEFWSKGRFKITERCYQTPSVLETVQMAQINHLCVAIPAMWRLHTRHAAAVVLSDEVRIVIGVDRVVVPQLYHLFESVVDEDEADERREAFLCETREVLHQEAGVCGDQHQTEYRRPQADPEPELKVVQAVVSVEKGQVNCEL